MSRYEIPRSEIEKMVIRGDEQDMPEKIQGDERRRRREEGVHKSEAVGQER